MKITTKRTATKNGRITFTTTTTFTATELKAYLASDNVSELPTGIRDRAAHGITGALEFELTNDIEGNR